jgi:methylphosphotriester-DNA--protein-cysteine methyltransferase
MISHHDISNTELRQKIRDGVIRFGGNKNLKIYGILSCSSGKRMKRESRVFFVSETEAGISGYRPCAHCTKAAYQKWENGLV